MMGRRLGAAALAIMATAGVAAAEVHDAPAPPRPLRRRAQPTYRFVPGVRGRVYPEQSTRQQERAKRYENHVNPLTGHVTHGLKPAWAR